MVNVTKIISAQIHAQFYKKSQNNFINFQIKIKFYIFLPFTGILDIDLLPQINIIQPKFSHHPSSLLRMKILPIHQQNAQKIAFISRSLKMKQVVYEKSAIDYPHFVSFIHFASLTHFVLLFSAREINFHEIMINEMLLRLLMISMALGRMRN